METVCILCPKGCLVQMSVEGDHCITIGNACPKGAVFAEQEYRHPVRTLCTTVKTNSEQYPRLPVKTAQSIPKNMQMQVMMCLNEVCVDLPILVGTTIVENVLGTGVNIVATMTLEEV